MLFHDFCVKRIEADLSPVVTVVVCCRTLYGGVALTSLRVQAFYCSIVLSGLQVAIVYCNIALTIVRVRIVAPSVCVGDKRSTAALC